MHKDYAVMTDSDSDLLYSIADTLPLTVVKMPYVLDGVEYMDDNGRDGREKEFFDKMRAGSAPNTSLLPKEVYLEYFEPVLRERDLLFIAFSSQMSATINNIYAAREELLAKYPDRKMIVCDTLSISGPQTLLILGAMAEYEKGAEMEEIEQWIRDHRLCARAYFTVDDLKYLKRGGRISSTSAFMGSLLDIKPILTEGRGGKIDPVGKVQGRKRALRTIVDHVVEEILHPEEQELIVLHADAPEEAQQLADMLRRRIPTLRSIRLQMVGPVIGAHCGPGTLAACFMGKERST